MHQSDPDKDYQAFLKKLDKFSWVSDKVIRWFGITLCVILAAVAVGIYVVKGAHSTASLEQFTLCCVALLFLLVAPMCMKLDRILEKWVYGKDIALNPATMVLPVRGTVTLNDALHKMSTPVAAIAWGVLLGCVVFSLLFMLLVEEINKAKILCGAAGVTLVAVAGYCLLHLLWKRKSFIKKILRKTSKYLPTEVHEGFADSLDASLRNGVLSYEKELILTNDYILGIADSDTSFIPVAIPRAKVTEYVFYYQRIVGGRYSRTVGILGCRINEETQINLVVGPVHKAEKVLRILDHYQIPWTPKSLTYV